jgi:hypothetical protein
MRVDPRSIYRLRAAFGLGFVGLGIVTLWRVATVPAGTNGKLIGGVLAVALIALGTARVLQFVRQRKRGAA